MTYNVFSGTLNPTHCHCRSRAKHVALTHLIIIIRAHLRSTAMRPNNYN